MFRGDQIELRLIREDDLDSLFVFMSDLDTRGDYFPLGVVSEPTLRSEFAKKGFWDQDEGMLLIVDDAGDIVGEIEYFPVTGYLQATRFHIGSLVPNTPGRATPPRQLICWSTICSGEGASTGCN